jgi:thioredoxin-related protein
MAMTETVRGKASHRHLWLTAFALIGAFLVAVPASAEKKLLPEVESNEEGLHVQPWFRSTFLNLKDDMVEAAAEGKQLAIIWEQKGCPYCLEMHRVNLRDPETVEYIKKHFFVVQLNRWGDREVVDTDGERTTEKKLGQKYRVQFTPTIQFLPKGKPLKDGKASARDLEVWRLLGYWKPFHFQHTFVYVSEEGYNSEPDFQRWLQARARKYEAEGKEVKLW